ncbi:MAG: hypothetical protein HY902_12665 [Deltaproteobacteria bacterium]|nr:hypothetical protein [Deltaproteobacteria bacterium]
MSARNWLWVLVGVLGACETGYAGDTCVPDCPAGMVCNFGTCVLTSSNTAGMVGTACAQDSDCSSGTCFVGGSFSGGYCSAYCGAQIVAFAAECAPGAACVQLSEATAACMDQCGGADGGCRSGYQCVSRDGSQVCIPLCTSSDQCPALQRCDLASGNCVSTAGVPDGKVGSPCGSDSECHSEVCIDEAGSKGVWKGGYCFDICDAAGEGKPCTAKDGSQEGLCAGIPDPDGGETSYFCMAPCATSVDCRPDYMCTASVDFKTSSGLGVCLPSCTTYGCDGGQVCDPQSGVCVEKTSTPSTLEHVALGTVEVGKTASTFKTVSVSVPADAVSVTLYARPTDLSAELALTKATQPDGKVVLDYFNPLVSDFKVVPLGAGVVSALYPNSPRLGIGPGSYQFTWGSYGGATVQLDAVVKRASGLLQSGTLPVVLWFTNQSRLSAQNAPNDANLQSALAKLGSIYGAVGIQLGTATYKQVGGGIATSAAVIDNDGELQQLFATADGSSEPGLHYFFIDQFAGDGGGYVTLGQSGGIPGPPSFPGLPHGGVAVALAYLDDDVSTFAAVMAHEGGHYMGLFHTSEQNGKSFDPLLDTPQCPSTNDGDGDGHLTSEECSGHGATNLMFWLAGPDHSQLSADQRYVLLRNPTVSTGP